MLFEEVLERSLVWKRGTFVEVVKEVALVGILESNIVPSTLDERAIRQDYIRVRLCILEIVKDGRFFFTPASRLNVKHFKDNLCNGQFVLASELDLPY